jgi:hypothetical protein
MKRLLFIPLFFLCSCKKEYEITYTFKCVECIIEYSDDYGTTQRKYLQGDFSYSYEAKKGWFMYLYAKNTFHYFPEGSTVVCAVDIDGKRYKAAQQSGYDAEAEIQLTIP